MKLRRVAVYVCLLLCALPLLAQSPKVQSIAAIPEGVSKAVAAVLEEKGYRVTLDDGWTAELWIARKLEAASNGAADALYPGLGNGEFIGVLHLPKGMTDFRGQAVPAGTYTLRYQLLPQDANHLGVSPNPDYLLAIPAASDTTPEATYSFQKLVALSAKSTGAHAAVLALEKPGDPGTAAFTDEKLLILTVNLPISGGKAEPIGVVLKGQAAQ